MALTDRDKRTLRIGGIIVGVLLVGFLLLKLLGGGGGEEATSSPPLRTSSLPGGGGQLTETPSLAPSPVLILPVRDPFSIPPGFPVGSSGTSTSTGTDTGTTTTSTGTSTTTTTTGTGSSSTGTGTRTPSGSGGGSTTIGGHEVTLIDTLSGNGTEQATVSVDGTVYTPSVGQSFGPNHQYMLQSVSGTCATFLFGDEAFTLCVPQNK